MTTDHANGDADIRAEMGSLSFFDLVKCELCGVPWSDHNSSCFNDRNRNVRISLFVRAVLSGLFRHEHQCAVRNGLEMEV